MSAVLISKDGKQRIPVEKVHFVAKGVMIVHGVDGKTYEINTFDARREWNVELDGWSSETGKAIDKGDVQ